MAKYNMAKVTIDDVTIFSAYVLLDVNWNGFVLPYFLLEDAQKVCNYHNFLNPDAPSSFYDSQSDSFIIYEYSDDDYMANIYHCEDIEVNGEKKRAYAIGGGSWIWSIPEQLN